MGDCLIKGTQWKGTAIYAEGQSFPFSINITSLNGDVVEGNIIWETLDAGTLFLGKIKENNLYFTEYEAIYGEENVIVPSDYVGTINGRQIEGSIVGNENATFKLSFIGIYSNDVGMITLPNQVALPHNPQKKNIT